MRVNRSLEIAIEEAIAFVESTYPNCLFTNDEITTILKAAFVARKRDSEGRAVLYESIGRIIDGAVDRRQAAVAGEAQ